MNILTTKILESTKQFNRLLIVALFGLGVGLAAVPGGNSAGKYPQFPGTRTAFAFSTMKHMTPQQAEELNSHQVITVHLPGQLQLPHMSLPLLRANTSAQLLSPNAVKKVYNLTGGNGGSGTIAIVDADNDLTAEADLGTFSTMYHLPACTTANGCFTKYLDTSSPDGTAVSTASDAVNGPENQMETTLDIEWAHAIAPNAKILLVEEPDLSDFTYGVVYASAQSGVVAVSLSLGGPEVVAETSADPIFTAQNGGHIAYFAASGDCGYIACGGSSQGPSYPATSPNVISVGGTTLGLKYDGSVRTESAWGYQVGTDWVGTGGGLSAYETEPSYQTTYNIPNASGKRGTPDVSLVSDTNTGFPIYTSTTFAGHPEDTGWLAIGGTSAATPIWAAISTMVSGGLTNTKIYHDAKATPSILRDITLGQNGPCGALCNASVGYDYATGLGVPNTLHL